mgnify:CR=1 FL=1
MSLTNPVTTLTIKGGGGLIPQPSTLEFDPDTGYTAVDTYEGSENNCKAAIAQYAGLGYRVRVYQKEGPVWLLEVRYGSKKVVGNEAETPNDQWTFDKEFVQVDMRNHPNIIALASTADTLNLWISEIDELIKNGTPPSGTNATGYLEIYALRSFGQKAFEVERLVLRRERTYSTQYINAEVIESIPKIYTTAKLITTFSIPEIISDRFPTNPSTVPDYHAWAWKKRRDSTQIIPGLGKVQEQNDWVFAAWPTVAYTLIA